MRTDYKFSTDVTKTIKTLTTKGEFGAKIVLKVVLELDGTVAKEVTWSVVYENPRNTVTHNKENGDIKLNDVIILRN